MGYPWGGSCDVDYRRDPSGKKLASVILELEKMKLVKLAFELEKKELAEKENSP